MIKKFKIFEKYYDIDTYREVVWNDDDLSPLLMITKFQNKPYDQITHLNCSCSQLTSLEGIENLVNLEHLDCSGNRLTSLDGVKNLINLKNLYCFYNQLINLEEIKNLVNLEMLLCSSNQLTSLDGIKNLVKLEYLDCYNNRLTNIDLEGIEDLYNIGVDGMGLFDNLKKLTHLNIQSNNLSEKYKDYLKKKFKNIILHV